MKSAFQKRHNTAGTHSIGSVPYHIRWIRLMHKHVTTHCGIEGTLAFEVVISTDSELSIAKTTFRGASTSCINRPLFTVDSNYGACRSNGFSDKHRNIANAATQI
jgi:hypothetical protein